MSKVSVIIPVYNAEKYLNKCLGSLVNQTLKDIEIIAVNDGSTDNSLGILERYQDSYRGMVRVINSANSGAGGARNKGLDIATGEYIKFVDADDFLKIDILEKMYEIAKVHKAGLVRGNYKFSFGSFGVMNYKGNFSGIKGSQLIGIKDNKDLMVTELSGVGNKLIRHDIVGDLKFPERTKWEDLAVIPVTIASSESIYYMDEPIYNYRINRSTTFTEYVEQFANILDVFKCVNLVEQHMKDRGLNEEFQEQIKGLFILHCIMKTENVMHWPSMSIEEKKEIINSIVNLIELKYADWKANRHLKMYSDYNPTFKVDMAALPKYLDDSMRHETSEKTITQNVVDVFSAVAAKKKKQ